MAQDLDRVRAVAQAILDRLSHSGVSWTVLDVTLTDPTDIPPPRPDLPPITPSVLVTAAPSNDPSSTVAAHFAPYLPEPEAIVQMADSMQGEVLEALGGVAVPECPGHAHPMSPSLDGGIPVWVCPATGRPVERIIK